jgi:hypothetical protein
MTAEARLISHKDTYKTTLADVRTVKAPHYTETWYPIAHSKLIDMVVGRLKKNNMYVAGEGEFSLNREKTKMFGVFNLKSEKDAEFTLAMGIRNSIDKSLPAGICCGSRVFVCDNLSFSSDIVIARRHTPSIMDVLPGLIDDAIIRFSEKGEQQSDVFNRMKLIEVPIPTAMKVIQKLSDEKFIQSPSRFDVLKEFEHSDRFPEFRKDGHSVWTLLNACTTYCRHDRMDINPQKAQENLLGIQTVIESSFGLIPLVN